MEHFRVTSLAKCFFWHVWQVFEYTSGFSLSINFLFDESDGSKWWRSLMLYNDLIAATLFLSIQLQCFTWNTFYANILVMQNFRLDFIMEVYTFNRNLKKCLYWLLIDFSYPYINKYQAQQKQNYHMTSDNLLRKFQYYYKQNYVNIYITLKCSKQSKVVSQS